MATTHDIVATLPESIYPAHDIVACLFAPSNACHDIVAAHLVRPKTTHDIGGSINGTNTVIFKTRSAI